GLRVDRVGDRQRHFRERRIDGPAGVRFITRYTEAHQAVFREAVRTQLVGRDKAHGHRERVGPGARIYGAIRDVAQLGVVVLVSGLKAERDADVSAGQTDVELLVEDRVPDEQFVDFAGGTLEPQ